MNAPGAIGAALAIASTAIYAMLLDRLRRFDDAHRSTPRWWLGYARDGANLAGALLYWSALHLAGLSGPSALVVGVALLLAAYLLDWTFGRRLPRPPLRRVALALVAVAAAACAVAAQPIGRAVERLVLAASPR
jgi:hypothetical protein